MIQRIKKPEIKPKEERKKSPKREKPLINNKNVNNNDNYNNIIVNIPQAAPIAPKKKRKPKPKITDTAKEDFQKTLNEFAQGNYPPIDIPDITKIKTTAQLNDITNKMKAIMGKPTQAAITGGQAPPAIMGGQTPPAMTGGQAPPAIIWIRIPERAEMLMQILYQLYNHLQDHHHHHHHQMKHLI